MLIGPAQLFELSWDVGMVLNVVVVVCIDGVHILIVADGDLSHKRIVVDSAISRRRVIRRFVDYLLLGAPMIFLLTSLLWLGRLSHTNDIVFLKLVSIVFIGRFGLAMYVVQTVVLVFCRWADHGGLL